MATHVIDVRLTRGNITVTPDPLEMLPYDDVTWRTGGSGRVRIEFAEKSPFEGAILDHARATGANRPRDEAGAGSYKYTVVDEADTSNRLDPVVIIKTPPTGGELGP